MGDLRYTFAKPIEIENIGRLYPCRIYDFWEHKALFNILNITVKTILVQIPMKQKKERELIEKSFKNFDVVMSASSFVSQVVEMLSFCFKINKKKIKVFNYNNLPYISLSWDEELYAELEKGYSLLGSLDINSEEFSTLKSLMEEKSNNLIEKTINRDNYDFIRNEIIKINDIQLPRQSGDPELQKHFEKAERAKRRQSENIDLDDIITTIIAFTGYTYETIENISIRQLNKLIARLNIIKNYDTCISYICAGASDVKVTSYLEHIEDNTDSKLGKSFDEFKNSFIKKGFSK